MGKATVNVRLQVNSGNLKWTNTPQTFTTVVNGDKGPTPAYVTVPENMLVIDLSALDSYGLCQLYNQDPTNYVEYGVYDAVNDIAHFPFELRAGELALVRLSRFLGQELNNETGTATIPGGASQFVMKAVGGPCRVQINAFDD